MTVLLALDHRLFLVINHLQGGPIFDALCLWGTELGTIVGTALALILYFLRAPRPLRFRRLGLLASIVAFAGLMNTVIKQMVQRERPPLVLPETLVLGPRLTLFSFPSGHCVMSFSLLAVLLVIDKPLGIAWLPIAFFVGFSRMYLGVHFPSDVLFGAAFGFFGLYPLAKRVWAR